MNDRSDPQPDRQREKRQRMVERQIASRGVGDDRVLEVGAGSGYAAAVLSRLAAQVFTVERHRSLAFSRERLERAIGVIYRPTTERMSHYFHAVLPRQFDEWLFVDRTTAVEPLVGASEVDAPEVPDTFPFAV